MDEKRFNLYCFLRDILYLLLGTISLALGLDLFLVPNKIATGGVAGLSIVMHYLVHLPTGMLMLLLNIPMFIFGWRFFGRVFLVRTGIAMLLVSFFTDFFAINLHLSALTDNLILATLYGGLLVGVGLGLVFKGDASAGGGTILAKVISQRTRFKTGQILFMIDLVVITSAAIVFRNVELALWGFITIFIGSQIVDLILTGKPFAKVVYVVSDEADRIGRQISSQITRGTTLLKGQDVVANASRNILVVVVDPSQISRLRDLVRRMDPDAFMVVTEASEILGKGF